MNKITVVGSFVMDLIGTMENFPLEGQTIIGNTFKTLPGGKGANQAVSAARLGCQVEMIGTVGNDAFGDTFKKVFKEENIDITHVQTSSVSPTAVGLIQINNKGENKIVVIPGANYDYSIEDLNNVRQVIKDSNLIVAQLELKHEITFALIELCHELNVPIVLNPAPAIPINPSYLKKVTYLTPNETELEILSGIKVQTLEDTKMAIEKLLDIGVKNVIATLGSKGALIGNQSGFDYVPGFKVKAVDTVAAGDSFNGALAYGIVNGKSLHEAVRYANAVGALTVTKQGAIPSLPLKEDVDKFIGSAL
jgi:ribokinase